MSKSKLVKHSRGTHSLSIIVSFEMKERLRLLAGKYDRTVADMVRSVLKVGIPMMEGLSAAEETMVREYVEIFRRLRKVKSLKDI